MVKKIVSIALVAFAGVCMVHGQPVKSSIGARTIASQGGSELTAKDYVQDGLVAMWDGIENAGWGTHDSAATTWKDLTGNGWDGAIGTSVIVESNAMKMDGVRGIQSCVSVGTGYFGRPAHVTIECVIQPLGWNYRGENGTVAAFGSSEARSGGFTLFANGSSSRCIMQMKDSAGMKYAESPFTMAANMGEIWALSVSANGTALTSYASGSYYASVTMGDLVYTDTDNWNFFLGADYWGPTEFNFNGRLFIIRIYNCALTPEEIAHNFAVDKARFGIK